MANAQRKAGVPRWLKAMIGVAGLALVGLGGAMLLAGHNPMQHFGMHMGG
jgi:hypothetical protein